MPELLKKYSPISEDSNLWSHQAIWPVWKIEKYITRNTIDGNRIQLFREMLIYLHKLKKQTREEETPWIEISKNIWFAKQATVERYVEIFRIQIWFFQKTKWINLIQSQILDFKLKLNQIQWTVLSTILSQIISTQNVQNATYTLKGGITL